MSRLRSRCVANREAGFTLVELLLAIVVMGMIMAPLTAGVIVGLRTTADANNRLAGSNDAQLLSIWLPPDVHSAGNQAGDVVAAPTANTECSGVTNLLRLRWRETQSSTTTFIAAYAVQSNSGTWRLVRYSCVHAGAATTHVIARNIAGSSAATVAVTGTRVELTVQTAGTATDPSGYTFKISGNRRTP